MGGITLAGSLIAILICCAHLQGQSVPSIPEDEEVVEEELEDAYEAFATARSRSGSQFFHEILRLPGMTYSRAIGMAAAMRLPLSGIDSVDTKSEFPPVELASIGTSRPGTSRYILRTSLAGHVGSNDPEGRARHKLFFRWQQKENDQSLYESDISLSRSKLLVYEPLVYFYSKLAEDGVELVGGTFRDRTVVPHLEESGPSPMRSLSDILSVTGPYRSFSRPSALATATNITGFGMRYSPLSPLEFQVSAGTDVDNFRSSWKYRMSGVALLTEDIGMGLTVVRSSKPGLQTLLCIQRETGQTSVASRVLVGPTTKPSFSVGYSGDIGDSFLLALEAHNAFTSDVNSGPGSETVRGGVSAGIRWGIRPSMSLETFVAGTQRMMGGNEVASQLVHSIQFRCRISKALNVRARLKSSAKGSEENSSADGHGRTQVSLSADWRVVDRMSIKYHFQDVSQRMAGMLSQSSLSVAQLRWQTSVFSVAIWVSVYSCSKGIPVWWQHPGNGRWPIPIAFSGAGSRTGVHIGRVDAGLFDISGYILLTSSEQGENPAAVGSLMMESRL